MARPPNPELTNQQRRVLELMAHGCTNAEIADALGISLDGAKYHVREVFDKLGVNSRAQAVAAWRTGQPSLWQRLRGWLWPVGAVAAGVGVAAVGVVAIALNQTGNGTTVVHSATAASKAATVQTAAQDPPALPANWQLWTAIVTQNDAPGAEPTTLRVMTQEQHSAASTNFSDEGRFGAVGWSPDGTQLAAASQDVDASGQISIYQRADWSSRTFSVRDTPISVIWSPDGKYIAALGRGLAIYRPDGAVVAEFMPATSTGETSNGLVWSPGGTAVDAIVDGTLRVVTIQGSVQSFAPPAGLNFTSTMAWAWKDDHTPVVVGIHGRPTSNPQPTGAYSVDIASDPPGWEKSPIRTTGVMRPLSDAVRAASASAPTGTTDLTAVTGDGAFGLIALFDRLGEGTQYHWTITAYDGEAPFAVLDLGITEGLPPNGDFAAVVVSGSR